MKNTEIADLISENTDKISEVVKELLTQSYNSPSFSGWTYRIVIFKNGNIEYLLSNNGSFIAEKDNEAFFVANIEADLGNSFYSMEDILEQLDVDEQKAYVNWCIDSEIIFNKELDDYDYEKINEPMLYKRFDEKNYNKMLKYNMDIEIDHHQDVYMDKVYDLIQELRSDRAVY